MLTRSDVTCDQLTISCCTVPKVIHTLCTVRWIGVSRTVIMRHWSFSGRVKRLATLPNFPPGVQANRKIHEVASACRLDSASPVDTRPILAGLTACCAPRTVRKSLSAAAQPSVSWMGSGYSGQFHFTSA
jgi:hypothetical protein